MIDVADLARGFRRISYGLARAATTWPGSTASRNEVGNLVIVTADGDYAGWVDVTGGQVYVFVPDEEGRPVV
jgi:hypothetical protein